ncbi:proline dehydrogenase family protein [Spirosoma sp. BT702]|uniref:Proline dehydrogenase family protein n=1 Tax=Spirosoma profusum TaxID=2771354 RepID=A0A927ATA7_9BACT|nr:proline dehydrogenase family protein [Spirosoma profusum]MBD2699717.1 proline dehydrogenase family protein [Spirosoma profusum]
MPETVQGLADVKSDVDGPVSFEDTSIAFSSQSDFKLRKTYWLFALMNQGWLVNLGTFFIKIALRLRLPIKFLIKNTIFEQFCGGESIRDCETTIHHLHKAHVGTILDYSVEGEDTEKSFDDTGLEIIRTIERASESADIPFSVFKMTGVASTELLEAVQIGDSLNKEQKAQFDRVLQRVDMLCRRAHERNVRIFVDAEESWIQDTIDTLAYEMMDRYNHEHPIVYNTYQMYRWESLDHLRRDTAEARAKGYFLGVKLVRGAYLEKERLRAHEEEYQDPIQATKEDTDRDFNTAIDFCLENRDVISICLGTHNEYSCQYCIQQMKQLSIANDDPHIYFAQLLGMSDNISYNLANSGYNVAKYVPYGPVESVMPYLFRRADENKSIAGQSSREFTLVSDELKRRKGCRQ